MAEKKGISSFSGGGKNRIMLFIAILIVAILVAIGYWQLKNKALGPQASASLEGAPKIESTPGVGKAPPREYIKLQQQQNAQEVIEAQKKGSSAVPTIIRASYLGEDLGKSNTEPDAKKGEFPGCDLESLRRAKQAGVSAIELRCKGCSAVALRAAGYTAGELREAGFATEQLKNSGFVAQELKAAGFNVEELKAAGFGAKNLMAAGFSVAELKKTDFTNPELAAAGFSPEELKAADLALSSTKPECRTDALKRLRAKEPELDKLKAMACNAVALRAAGYTSAELKEAGFAPKELKESGFSPKELKTAGFSTNDLKTAGYSSGELKNVGFAAEELKNAGSSPEELRKAGFSINELKRAGFSGPELKAAGYSDGELTRAGINISTTAADATPSQAQGPAAQVVSIGGVVGSSGATQSDPAAAALERLQRMQVAQISDQERKQRLDQMRQGMASQANDLMASWSPPTMQTMVMGVEEVALSNNTDLAQGAGTQGSAANGQGGQGQKMAPGTFDVIKAGTVMFAVLDVGINSDEESPILATIVEGQLRGAKLLGQFTRKEKKVLVTFNLMNVPRLSDSVPVSAVAIDSNTAHTLLADRVDSHYLLRYGTLFGSSFITGLADAVGKSGSSTVVSPVGVTVTQPPLDTTKLVITGLGQVGKQYSSSLSSNFTTPPTVYVNSGSAVGVLFMTDLKVPKPIDEIIKN